MRIRVTYTFLIVILCGMLGAQDIQFSQYYSAPLFLNPAFTGANVCYRMSGNVRSQWPGTGKGYVSEIFSLDHFDVQHNMGYGGYITNDVAGAGALHTLSVDGSFAYEAMISRRFAVRFGVQAGITTKSVDLSKLIFADQLARGGADIPTLESVNPRVTFPNFHSGLLGYGKDYWVGFSIRHLFSPEESLLGSSSVLPRKISLHGGKKFFLNGDDDKPEGPDTWTIMPTFNYKHQAKFDQLDIGCYLAKDKITFGFWYRGIPGFKAYKAGYPNNDAVVLLIGMNADKLHIGYSYDITTSWLTMKSMGAHELSISYQPCKLKGKKKKSIVISCPKF